MVPIKSPHVRTVRVKTGERINNGRALAIKAQGWMERNGHAFFELYRFVKRLQAEERIGRVRDRVAVWCMAHGIEVGDDPYKFGNAYWAGIARYIALYDPSLVGAPLKFHDSDIDCYRLLPVSYLPNLGEEYPYER